MHTYCVHKLVYIHTYIQYIVLICLQVLFSGDCKSVVYPCHSLVVDMDISSEKQRFFIGHTDKVIKTSTPVKLHVLCVALPGCF